MKAMIYTRYGSPEVLHHANLPIPTPKADQVLVEVGAASVNSADVRLLQGQPFVIRLAGYGLFRPKHRVLGTDIAGTVEAVGDRVTAFKPGDAVYGDLSGSGMGGFAEYAVAPATALAPMPPTLGFEGAAAVPLAGVTALQALRDTGKLQPGERVAINGASGGVGTFAVQIACAMGAEVTAVTSAGKLDLMRDLGAADAIDYSREDFTARAGQYDVILGINGYHPLADYLRALRPGGRYVAVGGSDAQIFDALMRARFTRKPDGKKLVSMMAKPNAADLRALTAWIERGAVKPIIERSYPLTATADAMRDLLKGHATGKFVIVP